MIYIDPKLDGKVRTTTRQVLDGVEFRIILQWLAAVPRVPFYPEGDPPPPLVISETPGVWTVKLAQSDGTIILGDQALRHGVNVYEGYKRDARFPGLGLGRLLAYDFTGRGQGPGRNDLDVGSSRRLVYLTASEVA